MKEASRKIKDEDIMKLYEEMPSYNVDELREAVKTYIENARVPNQAIIRQLPFMSRKKLMTTITNFYLKGSGLGVR